MKVRRTRKEHFSAEACSEIILSLWRELGSPAVGESELTRLRQGLAEVFGPDELPGPARIARQLAQEGATLRHPDIIESDARWREAQIASRMNEFGSLQVTNTGVPLRLSQAAAFLAGLEELRVRFVSAGDEVALADLKTFAIEARQAAKNHGQDESLSKIDREVQNEISEWLRVWLETPNLFAQWLELRQTSTAFKEKFPESD